MRARIQTLEEDKTKHAQAELSSLPATAGGDHEDTAGRSGQTEREQGEAGDRGEEGQGRHGDLENAEKKKERSERRQHKGRERAARIIQANWRQHRHRVCGSPRLHKMEL